MEKYSLLLQWSEEDKCYLATCPEFKGDLAQPFAHGDTWEEAGKEAAIALKGVTEVMAETKMPLPKPRLYQWSTNGAES